MELIHFLVTGSTDYNNLSNLEHIITTNSINFTIGSSLFLLVLVLIAAAIHKPSEIVKWFLFLSMILIISVNTLYLAGSTVYQNQRSVTKGPVHWHADFEIWNCGQKVNLKDPTGWSNKIGNAVYHEHNDDRMHVEGVVLDMHDASLGNFFKLIGGGLSKDTLTAPVNEGMVTMKSGDTCNGNWGELQVFVFKVRNNVYTQEKLKDPAGYVPSPYGTVPPADCIIFEFDSTIKEKTDKLCQSYQVQKQLGKIHGE